jgi:hypothetical protein
MWTPGQLAVFAIVMAVVGGMAVFLAKVRSTFWKPASCPSCGGVVARNATVCPTCGNTL